MRYIVLIVVAISLSACRDKRQSLPQKEKERVEAEVREMMERYGADVERDGLLAELGYLDSSADFFWIPPGYTAALSYDSVASILRENAPKLKHVKNEWEQLSIQPLTSALATYHGTMRSAVDMSDGSTHTTLLIESGVLIRRNEGWKLLSGQTRMLN